MKVLSILLVMFLIGCTNPGDARRVLLNQGYTDIELNGFDMFSCGSGDTYADSFTAISPNGSVVTGTVCSGVLKGYTIRFN